MSAAHPARGEVGTGMQVLFLTALLGVLGAVGLALSSLGWVVVTAYAAVVVTTLALLAARARAGKKADDGRTCSCCTSTVFDPVEVR